MIPPTQALEVMLSRAKALASESVELDDAFGRFLARDLLSEVPYPAFDLSMMDGIAVDDSTTTTWQLAGETRAGDPPPPALAPGCGWKVYTGSPLPSGTKRVIPHELYTEADGGVKLNQALPGNPFIRPRGSEANRGDVVLAAGACLDPLGVALVASLGHTQVKAYKRPRVTHLTLGSELLAPGDKYRPGCIYDSNTFFVGESLRRLGIRPTQQRIEDDYVQVKAAVGLFVQGHSDLLLISGGASGGDYDYARRALVDQGFQLHFDRLALKPGKPTIYATLGDKHALAIPGNPVAHLTVFALLVRPLLLALQGSLDPRPKSIPVRIASVPPGQNESRHVYWPSRLEYDDAELRAHPLRFTTSGDLLGVATADALLSLPRPWASLQPGETVPAVPLFSF